MILNSSVEFNKVDFSIELCIEILATY